MLCTEAKGGIWRRVVTMERRRRLIPEVGVHVDVDVVDWSVYWHPHRILCVCDFVEGIWKEFTLGFL